MMKQLLRNIVAMLYLAVVTIAEGFAVVLSAMLAVTVTNPWTSIGLIAFGVVLITAAIVFVKVIVKPAVKLNNGKLSGLIMSTLAFLIGGLYVIEFTIYTNQITQAENVSGSSTMYVASILAAILFLVAMAWQIVALWKNRSSIVDRPTVNRDVPVEKVDDMVECV